jgi:hypothetical protein
MTNQQRGTALTIFAILFALMAISNFSKPFQMSPDVGFVFLGTKLHGSANKIIAPIFGIVLAVYAYGIWKMRKFALPIGYFYAAYVIVNLVLYTIKNRGTGVMPPASFMIGYAIVAIGVSSGAAVLLTRRKADLS